MTSVQIDVLDGLSSATAIKGPCRVATNANITLSGEQTIAGVAAVAGDRVLVKDQADPRENGIYEVSTGDWRRTSDFSRNDDVVDGTIIAVRTAQFYMVSIAGSMNFDTTEIAFNLVNEPLDVSWFGATGDGVTDDSAAFVAMMAAGAHGRGRAGNIYVVKDLVFNGFSFDGQGCVFRPATGAKWMIKLSGYAPRLRNCFVQDNDNYVVSTTLASSPTAGASSFTVASATGLEARQVVFVKGNGNEWFHTLITSVAGTTVNLRAVTPDDATSGAAVIAFHGCVVVEDANWYEIEGVQWINARAALILKPSSSTATSGKGTLSKLRCSSVLYVGFAKYENCHDVNIDDVQLWGGYVQTYNHVGDGTAGPFSFTNKVYLKRDVTVTVNGVAKTNPTHWTYSSQTGIQFTVGNYPANGAAIVITHFRDGLRGFIEDQRNTTVISGGNQYSKIKVLDFFIGLDVIEGDLTDFDGITVDTCQYSAILLSSCTSSLRFGTTFCGYCASSIKAFSTSGVEFSQLYTKRVPSSDAYLGASDDNIYVGSGSKLLIDTPSWTGGDYQVNGSGKVFFKGARVFHFSSTATVAAGSTVYFGADTPQSGQVAAFMAPEDMTILEAEIEIGDIPGAGQSFTYTLQVNEVDSTIFTGAISNTGVFALNLRGEQAVTQFGRLLFKLVTSAGANARQHRMIVIAK